jgi:hypothetical protein
MSSRLFIFNYFILSRQNVTDPPSACNVHNIGLRQAMRLQDVYLILHRFHNLRYCQPEYISYSNDTVQYEAASEV